MRARPIEDLRPLPAAEARWDEDGVVFAVGSRTVDVRGDAAVARAVIADCDGTRTVAELAERHGPDADELVRGLLEAGALVDSERAWRRLHRLGDNPSPLLRGDLDEAEHGELLAETYGPLAGHGDPIALAPESSQVGTVARRRASGRAEGEPRPATWGSLSALLAAAYGSTDGRWLTVPSGGALYGLVVHVLLRRPLGPLEAGIWWYDPWRGEVRPQTAGTPAIEPLLASHPVTDPLLSRGEPLVAISADLRRVARKYGARGYRLALMEAGAAMQTAYLFGAETELPVRACAGFADAGVAALLDLPEDVEPLLLLFAGS